ncbi:CoA-transferase [Alteribacillus sp. JSM 102045]|uniref:CoA-transferase n=1 Tax=Alteribacillus sp. JSM 102045 TaxID=1562101 RepID=UPI0035C1C712
MAAYFTRTAVGTKLADGKEVREFDGEPYVLEKAIKGDVSLVKALKADTMGNLYYHKTGMNFRDSFYSTLHVCVWTDSFINWSANRYCH